MPVKLKNNEQFLNNRELCRRSGIDDWAWIGMVKESAGGRWRFTDGSDVPASFDYEWTTGYDSNYYDSYRFMLVYCRSSSNNFGRLRNSYNNNNNNFICQDP